MYSVEQLPRCDLLRLSPWLGDSSCRLDETPERRAIFAFRSLFFFFFFTSHKAIRPSDPRAPRASLQNQEDSESPPMATERFRSQVQVCCFARNDTPKNWGTLRPGRRVEAKIFFSQSRQAIRPRAGGAVKSSEICSGDKWTEDFRSRGLMGSHARTDEISLRRRENFFFPQVAKQYAQGPVERCRVNGTARKTGLVFFAALGVSRPRSTLDRGWRSDTSGAPTRRRLLPERNFLQVAKQYAETTERRVGEETKQYA